MKHYTIITEKSQYNVLAMYGTSNHRCHRKENLQNSDTSEGTGTECTQIIDSLLYISIYASCTVAHANMYRRLWCGYYQKATTVHTIVHLNMQCAFYTYKSKRKEEYKAKAGQLQNTITSWNIASHSRHMCLAYTEWWFSKNLMQQVNEGFSQRSSICSTDSNF